MFRKLTVMFVALASFAIVAAPSALAQRQLMIFKTNVPLDIPGKVLNPGRYTLVKVNGDDTNGPIAIQNSRGRMIGEYMVEPIRRAEATNNEVLEVQKQASAPPRLDYFIQAGRASGYKFMYAKPPLNPAGVVVANDVSLSQIEKKNG